jgi:hypothetical protein
MHGRFNCVPLNSIYDFTSVLDANGPRTSELCSITVISTRARDDACPLV